MDKASDIDLLEQYLREELSVDAVAQLELRLEKEAILVKQLSALREVQNGIRYARLEVQLEEIRSWELDEESITGGANDFEQDVADMIHIEKNRELLEEIQTFEEIEPKKEVKIRRIGRYWWGVAAGFLLILGALFFLFQEENQLTNEELFAMYFEPYPVIGIKRGEEGNDLKSRAFNYYDDENYASAIPLFKELILNHNDTLSQFYLGVSMIGNKEFDAGLAKFYQIKDEQEYLLEQANWYIFLGYLGMGNKEMMNEFYRKAEFGSKSKNVEQIISNHKMSNK